MKNITLSADEQIIKRARAAAKMRGMSLNQMIRDYLEELASGSQTDNEFQRLEELSKLAAGQRGGWKFDRDEIHERS